MWLTLADILHMISSIKRVAWGFLYCTFLVWGAYSSPQYIAPVFLHWHLSGSWRSCRQPGLWITAAQIWMTWRMIPIFQCRCQSSVCVYDECVQKMGMKSSPETSASEARAVPLSCRFLDWLWRQKEKGHLRMCIIIRTPWLFYSFVYSAQIKFTQINV